MTFAATWSQRILGLAFVAAGAMHFITPRFYIAMMPKLLPRPWHAPLVVFTGICEILGGLGVLPDITRPMAGWGLFALLIAVFPANVQMLVNAHARGAPTRELATLVVRLPIQLLLLWWVWRAAIAPSAA